MKKDISVIKEQINIYNQVFNLAGKELKEKVIYSDDRINELDDLTYDKYLELSKTLKIAVDRVIMKGLNNSKSKISKKVLELKEPKIVGNLMAFYKYGEYLKESLKEVKKIKRKEIKDKAMGIFKKDKKKSKKIDLETIGHYIVMGLIPVASIGLFNFLSNLGVYVTSLSSYFTLGTLGIMGYKQARYMFKRKKEEKKEKELARRVLELVREAKEVELENEKQVKNTKKRQKISEDFEFDLDFEDEEEFIEFEDEDYEEEEELELPTFEEEFVEFEDESDELEEEEVELPTFEEEYDDEYEDEEEVELPTTEIQEDSEKNKEEFPRGRFLDMEAEDFEDEEIDLPISEEEFVDFEEEYDDEYEDEQEVELPTSEEELESEKQKKNTEKRQKMSKEFRIVLDYGVEGTKLPLSEERKNVDLPKTRFAEPSCENDERKELVTLRMLKNEIERAKLLKEDLENKLNAIYSKIDVIKKENSGKNHYVLMKEDADYAKLYKEKLRSEKLYNEAIEVLNYSLNMYFSISMGQEVTIGEYFEKLKEGSLKK